MILPTRRWANGQRNANRRPKENFPPSAESRKRDFHKFLLPKCRKNQKELILPKDGISAGNYGCRLNYRLNQTCAHVGFNLRHQPGGGRIWYRLGSLRAQKTSTVPHGQIVSWEAGFRLRLPRQEVSLCSYTGQWQREYNKTLVHTVGNLNLTDRG